MANPKSDTASNGQPMHYSVGAIIKRGGNYLLVDRNIQPFGFASVAGHIDEGENRVQAIVREIKEESGLKVKEFKQILEEEVQNNTCSRGIPVHYWYLFEVDVEGEPECNERESKSIGWYSLEEIKSLKLEPVWKYWFEKLKII